MEIILTNNHLKGLGGTETWTYTMAKELESRGHKVGVFTHQKGYVSNLLADMIDDTPKGYDLALINHNTCLNVDAKYKIFTSHGVIPALEQPRVGADKYVAVSEEVQDNLKGFDSSIIRNPIDCEKYKPFKPVNKTLKKVLFSSNYQGYARDVVIKACQGLDLEIIGKGNRVADVVSKINEADLVIGLGRTSLEAMACNRNVIVFDYNGADGFVTPETIKEFRKNNCSGRRYRKKFTVEDLKNEFKKYDPELNLREYILKNNNVKNIVDKYLYGI